MFAQRAVALFVILTVASSVGPARAASPQRWTLELMFRGQRIQGTPLEQSASNVVLLTRDGRLMDIDPRAATEARKTSESFKGLSPADLRGQLFTEMGKQFDVTGTGHYLVVHPKGQKDLWGQRFEEMYRSFVYWFRTRGFNLQEPEFPLIAIVFPDREQFQRYFAQEGVRLSGNILGFYANQSNRVALYDIPGDWQQNADTIVHEVTHQTAYNTGVHNRFTKNPRWVVEGLGTLFEARGIWNWRSHTALSDRVNRGHLKGFRQYKSGRPGPETLMELVGGDRLFDSNPNLAYDQSWALTMYLVETQPQKYSQYLAKLAARPNFAAYPQTERLADFTAIFGANWALLESHFARFIEGLK